MTWNYERIKALAAERRKAGEDCLIKDLCALDPQNDPFYTGRPSEIRDAEWFAELWRRFGYTEGVHLRRVHYQIASQSPSVELPTRLTWTDKLTKEKQATTIYLNVDRCWKFLANAAKWARYLELVPILAFDDRRNPEPKVYTNWTHPGDPWYRDPTPRYVVSDGADWDFYALPDLPRLSGLPAWLPDLPGFTVEGYGDVQQSYHVELWCEKTTMNDVLIPVCREHNVNLITGTGEMSITAVADFVERVRAARRPARILYASDHDPKGLDMPVSVGRKIEFLQRQRGYDDLDIKLDPIVLTEEQIKRYDLPPAPDALPEIRIELDALESKHEGELRRIVEEAIRRYHDPDLQSRAGEQRRKLRDALLETREKVMTRYEDDHDALVTEYSALLTDFEKTRNDFTELVADFREQVDAYEDRLDDIVERGEALWDSVNEDLDAVDLDAEGEYPLPDPDLAPEDDSALYAGGRGYLEQLERYREYRQNSNGKSP